MILRLPSGWVKQSLQIDPLEEEGCDNDRNSKQIWLYNCIQNVGAAINGYGSRMSMSAPVPGQKNP